MTNERIAMLGLLVTVLSISANVVLYLVSGGFSAGKELSEIKSELRMVRHEARAANQIQDFRLEKLEGNKPN